MPTILLALKKSVAFWSVLSVLAGAGGGYAVIAYRTHASDDCCAPGAPCCYPGSPCCAHGARAQR